MVPEGAQGTTGGTHETKMPHVGRSPRVHRSATVDLVFESPKEGAPSLETKPKKKSSSRIYTLVWKEFPSKSFAIKKRETSLSLACLSASAKTNTEK